MPDSPTGYGLDLHSTMILEDYCARIPVYEKIKEVVSGVIKKRLDDNGIIIAAYESRIKTQDSLAGKDLRKKCRPCPAKRCRPESRGGGPGLPL